MKCPHCNAPSEVLETRGVRRRRECFNGHRFTTEEQVVLDRAGRAANRRAEIGRRLAEGQRPETIASEMDMSFGGVMVHVRALAEKAS